MARGSATLGRRGLANGRKIPSRRVGGSDGGVVEVGRKLANLGSGDGHAVRVRGDVLEDLGVFAFPDRDALTKNRRGSSEGLGDLLAEAPLVESIRAVGLADSLFGPVDVFDELVVVSPSDDALRDSLAFDVARAVPTDPIFDGVVSDLVLYAAERIDGLSGSSPL